MAAMQLYEVIFGVPYGAARFAGEYEMPVNSEVFCVTSFYGQPRMLYRGDPDKARTVRYFVALQTGVPLTMNEERGTYLGSYTAYKREEPISAQVYHVFEVPSSATMPAE